MFTLHAEGGGGGDKGRRRRQGVEAGGARCLHCAQRVAEKRCTVAEGGGQVEVGQQRQAAADGLHSKGGDAACSRIGW